MDLFPAIDLRQGQCVRLTQGDFNAMTTYRSDPLEVAYEFEQAGAKWLHIVDLDGAKEGETQQLSLIEKITRHTSLSVQTGGGIRRSATIKALLDAGAQRVIVGSLAIENKEQTREWLKEFGADKIVLAFDIKYRQDTPEILTHGWQQGSTSSLWDVLNDYEAHGLKTVLCTDVAKDGMLEGSNNALYHSIQERHPHIDLLASGGIGSLDDLISLTHQKLYGVVVGKALYEGVFSLKDAISVCNRGDRHAR